MKQIKNGTPPFDGLSEIVSIYDEKETESTMKNPIWFKRISWREFIIFEFAFVIAFGAMNIYLWVT